MAKPKKKSVSKKSKKKKSVQSKKARNVMLFALGGIIAALIFLSTTILLMVAMLPTVVAYVVDTNKEKTLALTVGFMNFAGALPFILRLWSGGQNMVNLSDIISDPLTVVIIYASSGVGYLIDWVVTDAASSFIVKRSNGRMKAIKKQQAKLIERWGESINPTYRAGDIDLPQE